MALRRTIRCAHCHNSGKDVALWSQIIAIREPRDVVCCLIEGDGF